MPLTVNPPIVQPPAVVPPALTPPAITVTDAQMITALEADGYTVTKATSMTFTAKATGTNECTVSWSGVSPTELARNGTASGFGPWNTGPLTGEPTTGSYAFEELDPGTTYTYTLTYSGGSLTTELLQPGATETVPSAPTLVSATDS